MPELVEVAQRAWKGQWTGRRRLNGKTVYRDNKMVTVVRRKVQTNRVYANPRTAPVTHQIVFFPRPEHFPIFQKAGSHTDFFGPADDNPHAVATLFLRTHGGITRLDYAQGHYTVGKHMPRALATRYAGWLRRGLNQALDVAQRHHSNLVLLPEVLSGDLAAPSARRERTQKFRTALINELARERGLRIINDPRGGKAVLIRKRPAPGEFDI